MISIFILGLIKWIRGVILGKPVGYLSLILVFEGIVAVVFIFKIQNKR